MATIQGVYLALFGRPADPNGLAFFNAATNNGANLAGIGPLQSTAEYTTRFAGFNNNQIVTAIYQSLFNRDPELAGLTFFVDALNKGTLTINNIAIAILDGAQGNDKTILDAKLASAALFTAALDTAPEIGAYVGNNAAALGRAFLADVGTTPKTAAQADAAVAGVVSGGNAGNTFTMAAGVADTFSLTAGQTINGVLKTATNFDDTFNALTTANAAGNVTADDSFTFAGAGADSIDAGLGVDTLNVKIDANVTVGTDALKNLERIFITSDDGGGAATYLFAAANAAQQTQIWNNASVDGLTVSGIGASTTVGLKGAIAGTTEFQLTTTAGTTTLALAIDAATPTANAVTINGVEVLNISNTGTSNVGALTMDAAQTINVAGSGTLTLGTGSTTVETVSASAFTGALTFNAVNNTGLKSLVGGSGADVLTVDTTYANNLVVNAGAGADSINVNWSGATTKTLTITGGDGADIFTFGNTQRLDNLTVAATTADLVKSLITVTDFAKASDAIRVDDGAAGATGRDTLLDAELTQISSQADLRAAAIKAAEYTDATKFSVFNFGSDAYILVNNNTAALENADGLVKLTGVQVADLTATNFQVV